MRLTRIILLLLLPALASGKLPAQDTYTLSLNGLVDFEQTSSAFPPEHFTRKAPVPGLIDLATPRIEQYEKYFSGEAEPRYSWYRFRFTVPAAFREHYATLKILKSRYNTQVILNGHDCGTYMQCSTPIDCDLTPWLRAEGENILLVRTGDRRWLPEEAATGFDREKFADIPGIWDDVSIHFGGPVQLSRVLVLPALSRKTATVKVLLKNLSGRTRRDMEYDEIHYTLQAWIREKKSGKGVSDTVTATGYLRSKDRQQTVLTLPLFHPHPWSPADPFLYETVVTVTADSFPFRNFGNREIHYPGPQTAWSGLSDEGTFTFGMRDFGKDGRIFRLNGEEIRLRGSTITLNRFFEDTARKDLPWDREWVKKFLVSIPKALGWNYFRVSLGLLPSFWYDLADEYGFVIQNEYPMWNLRGNEEGYRKEYTDWIWSDGNHPSIVIWDALNEQKQPFIGKVLIPALRKTDPTRLWDAGWMDASELKEKDITEFHWYPLGFGWWTPDSYVERTRDNFRFGPLFEKYANIEKIYTPGTPVIVNEFGWLWQNRDGKHSGIRTRGEFVPGDPALRKKNYEYYEMNGRQLYHNRDVYDHYLGKDATAQERWDFQAYLLAIEIEIIRSTRMAAGIASFAYLSNDHGYTGDWFRGDIAGLSPTPPLLMQYHAMREMAVFIDAEDGRYLKDPAWYRPGTTQVIDLLAVNDGPRNGQGEVTLSLIDDHGKKVFAVTQEVKVAPFWQEHIPVMIRWPEKKGGYMLLSEMKRGDDPPQISRRYIRVGNVRHPSFPVFKYPIPAGWPAASPGSSQK